MNWKEWMQQLDEWLFIGIHHAGAHEMLDMLVMLTRNAFTWAPLYLFVLVYIIRYRKNRIACGCCVSGDRRLPRNQMPAHRPRGPRLAGYAACAIQNGSGIRKLPHHPPGRKIREPRHARGGAG